MTYCVASWPMLHNWKSTYSTYLFQGERTDAIVWYNFVLGLGSPKYKKG